MAGFLAGGFGILGEAGLGGSSSLRWVYLPWHCAFVMCVVLERRIRGSKSHLDGILMTFVGRFLVVKIGVFLCLFLQRVGSF